MTPKLAEILERHRASGLFTHAYCAYGRLAESAPEQHWEILPEARSLFDLASLTKALVTTPLIFAAVQSGRLALESTVGAWLGAAEVGLAPALRRLTVRQLLRHDTGLPAWHNWWVCHLGVEPPQALSDPVRRRQRLVEGLNRAAASIDPSRLGKPLYSDVGFLLLGLALEVTGGTDLLTQFDGFCRQLNLEPAALPLAYGPGYPPAAGSCFVPTGYCAVRQRQLVGEVHDENCASLGGVTAHAGLFGSGPGVARYLHALANAPVGQLLIGANAAERRMPPGDPPNESLLGWRQGADPSSSPFSNASAMGHMGFTGVAFWVCPDHSDYAMLLTNRVCSGRTRPGIAAMRRDVFAALAACRR